MTSATSARSLNEVAYVYAYIAEGEGGRKGGLCQFRVQGCEDGMKTKNERLREGQKANTDDMKHHYHDTRGKRIG